MEYFNIKKSHASNCSNVIGFFPGLGSRAEYQNIGNGLLCSGNKEIEQIYYEAAIAMGYGANPQKMLITSTTLPNGIMERQGFIGASFLIHNLALAAKIRSHAKLNNLPLNFLAYSGESFGIINAAIASGALSIDGGVKIANFFTPYILLASNKCNDIFSRSITPYYPSGLKQYFPISENYYVIALRGRCKSLTKAYIALQDHFLNTEVELHKIYSHNQINLYVKTSVKSCFDMFMKNYPAITVIKLKKPTAFITHSAQLTPLKQGLEQFFLNKKITFQTPHTPIIANHREKLLTSKEDVRSAIVAILDQVMYSEKTAKMADTFNADVILEFGLGNKSVQMLRDNNVSTPALSYTGDTNITKQILEILSTINSVRMSKNADQACSGINQWLNLTRENAELAMQFSPKITDAIQKVATFKLEVGGSAPITIESIYKNSWQYRNYIQPSELVLMARLRRNILGNEYNKNQTYVDLKILTSRGILRYQKTPFVIYAEKNLFYFSSLESLSNADIFNHLADIEKAPMYRETCQSIEAMCSQGESLRKLLQLHSPTAQPEIQALRRILLQMIIFELMKYHRPGLVQEGNTCLVTCDFLGWLACLTTARAISFDNMMQLCRDYYHTPRRRISLVSMLKKFSEKITNAHIPILSINGLPILTSRDIEANTSSMLLDDISVKNVQVSLGCNLSVITLDDQLNRSSLKTAPYLSDIILISSPSDIWLFNQELKLVQREREAQAYLTEEHRQLLTFATKRNLLCSTINSYIEADELPVNYCSGGSESLTFFIQRAPREPIVVRKILSEALTSTKWRPDGKGVMLPPFAKAARQVDYLRALPDKIKPWFPQVYTAIEREILTPTGQERVGKTTCKEVIYEMSYVEGEEISQFIQNTHLAPQIIARLYEIIFIFLRDNIHCQNRVANTNKTLETSYFKKIEDRLALCQLTAPQSFSNDLLGSEKIVINNSEYLNIKPLLNIFRSHPEYQTLLEPSHHSLVMGDTNTENIKIGNAIKILSIQAMISEGRSEEEIKHALAEIDAENIQLRFLDPRAIGYQSEGANCRDDYMYDNKPWHNSIGHYDELHNELFTLTMNIQADKYPTINIHFNANNCYQQSYQVTDCAQKNINPLNDPTIVGMEKYFPQVMNALYKSTNSKPSFSQEDPHWLVRFVFMMGTHFAAMPPFHFTAELDGSIKDSIHTQRRPIAIYCEGIKWLNWALEILQGKRNHFLGVKVPQSSQYMKKVI